MFDTHDKAKFDSLMSAKMYDIIQNTLLCKIIKIILSHIW